MVSSYILTIADRASKDAKRIPFTGTLKEAKSAATRAFGKCFEDHELIIEEKNVVVARKRASAQRWNDIG